MPRFFLFKEHVGERQATISGQELEHLRRVLRLGPGDRVTLFDDRGWEHEGVLASLSRDCGLVDIARSYQPERESPLEVTLAQALGKGDKMDVVVEKATELGVRRVAPFVSSRTVARPASEKLQARRARWHKIALSAAKQSGRTRVPEILEVCEFSRLVDEPWACELKLLLWEREPEGSLLRIREERPRLASLLLVVGPEGGFSTSEADQARRRGYRPIRLGKRILRTETAAIAALSAVQCLWGDLG